MERLEDFSVRFSHVSVYRFPGWKVAPFQPQNLPFKA